MSTVRSHLPEPATATPTWRVPFHASPVDEAAIEAVVDVLRSGWLTTGPWARRFETAFAEHLGGDVHAVAVSSATAALHLGLVSAGIGRGDLVLTTPYTFAATAEVIVHVGAEPVFVDVDPATGLLTATGIVERYEQLRPAVRRRVRAVMPVHFAGAPCPMTAIDGLAAGSGWTVVDDAAHALPAAHAGRPVGTHGDATAFSFYATKPLSTGEGGMVVTRDADRAAALRRLRLHGIDRDVFDRYHAADAWYYEVVAAGFKYNITDVCAALGVVHLARVDADRDRRAAIAATYTRAFADVEGLAPPPDAALGDVHAWHLYALRITAGDPVRQEFVRRLAAHGVGASVHFIPLHLQPYYRDRYALRPEDLPGATTLYRQEVSLPIFPHMTDDQVATVVETVPVALREALDACATAARAS